MKKFALFSVSVLVMCFFLQFTLFRLFNNDIVKILIITLVNAIIAFVILRKSHNDGDNKE